MIQNRQLAAIVFTDIVGFTTLMGGDETLALEILDQNRQIHTSLVDRYQGKIIKELEV